MAHANPKSISKRQHDDALIDDALKALKRQLRKPQTSPLSTPSAVKTYLQLELAREDREVFCVMYLDAQNRLIEFERVTTGTLMQASVYPREIARSALKHNAASVILSHNHPTGTTSASAADQRLTSTLKETLALFEIKVLDHIIIADNKSMSFSECGLI